ncbi:APC family permease [Neobacillus sp. OS1-32]|jgi:putrescine importer|uniref:APC family permease n=1 Tax=Neobacillus sp. OS1-32 TaxID=3070682 RepID=UPI0027DFD998|nr:APC family permease [Neobacillus sp. OS1-32]WML29019.1 APC family permease [Neobacillus sp. OS1-32]
MEKTVQLKRSLNFFHLVLLGLAYMAPLTVFSTFGIVEDISRGATPAAYLVALIAMLFTAYSYGRMSKAFPIAGSAYSYTQKSISSHLGFMVGWVILMDYLFIPMINFLILGLYMTDYFPSIPLSVWIIGMIVLVTAFNLIGMKVTVTMNMILLGFQYLVLIIFVILSIKALINGTGQGTVFSLQPFMNEHTSIIAVFSGASILCLSFLGFDALTTFAEETIKPAKTIPKAIQFVTLFAGTCFIIISYLAHLIHPDFTSYKNLDTASIEVAKIIGGTLFNALFIAAIVVTCFTSATASHASVSRILFAMGRDSVIPKKFFAYIHPKFRTPANNIILVGIIALAALFTDLVTITSFINFGALFAFTFVNLSVVAHYFIKGKQRSLRGTIQYLIIPIIGAGISLKLWSDLDVKSMTLGCIWAAVGLLYLIYKTKLFRVQPPQMDFVNVEETNKDLSM